MGILCGNGMSLCTLCMCGGTKPASLVAICISVDFQWLGACTDLATDVGVHVSVLLHLAPVLCLVVKSLSIVVLDITLTNALSRIMDKGLTTWFTMFVRLISLVALVFFFWLPFCIFFLLLLELDTLGAAVKSDISIGNTLSAVNDSTVIVLTLSLVLAGSDCV